MMIKKQQYRIKNTCKTVRVIKFMNIIIIAEFIIQDHDLQRSPVAFLPRNRQIDRKTEK